MSWYYLVYSCVSKKLYRILIIVKFFKVFFKEDLKVAQLKGTNIIFFIDCFYNYYTGFCLVNNELLR